MVNMISIHYLYAEIDSNFSLSVYKDPISIHYLYAEIDVRKLLLGRVCKYFDPLSLR